MKLAVVDVETTGLDPRTDRITEVGIRYVASGELWSTLVDPEIEVPLAVQHLTGLETTALCREPRFMGVEHELTSRLRECILIGHSVGFDLGMLRAEYERLGRRPPVATVAGFCTLKLARRVWPNEDSYSLSAVARLLDLDDGGAHRVEGDTLMTASVFERCRREGNWSALVRAVSRPLGRRGWQA